MPNAIWQSLTVGNNSFSFSKWSNIPRSNVKIFRGWLH